MKGPRNRGPLFSFNLHIMQVLVEGASGCFCCSFHWREYGFSQYGIRTKFSRIEAPSCKHDTNHSSRRRLRSLWLSPHYESETHLPVAVKSMPSIMLPSRVPNPGLSLTLDWLTMKSLSSCHASMMHLVEYDVSMQTAIS